ncbi:MAG: ABC transporter transmembrane domain-containing protein [Cyanobium sp.]
MTQSPALILSRCEAFRNLDAEDLQRLDRATSYVRFTIGQPILDGSVLPAQVFLVLQGEARLLGPDQDKLVTLGRLGPNNLLGLASLLRSSPCEILSAATEVVAATIPDEEIVRLYQSSAPFRDWCDHTLWPAELVALLNLLFKHHPRAQASVQQLLPGAVESCRLINASPASLESEGIERAIFLGSANAASGLIGDPVDLSHPPAAPLGPFGLRLIGVPWAIVPGGEPKQELAADSGGAIDTVAIATDLIKPAPQLPMASALTLGGSPSPLSNLQVVRAEGPMEEVLACFQMIAKIMKLPFRRDAIEKVLRDSKRRGQVPDLQMCGQLAASLGLHVVSAKVPAAVGTRLQSPSLLPWKGSFAVAVDSNSRGLTLAVPSEGLVTLKPQTIQDEFPEGIELLLMERSTSTPEDSFGMAWFLPVLNRYRGVLLQVLLASFVVQLFTLANPLLIQVIIDKVIRQRSLDTLQVLGFALVAVTVMEGVLTSLRTFLFAETTNRIDARLGAEVIDHLLRLPLGYFDRRPVGDLASRMGELEKIRNFLTGQALTTILDAAFSVIYIVVMAMYSWLLTAVALGVLPIQIGLTLLGAPLFRRQFRQAAEENSSTQSHLVEVLTGIQTVKAQNVEMISRWKWQERYSRYIARTFEKTITGTALNQTSSVLQKLSQLLVLWVGSALVLKGDLTLGQLIAFRIISGYVTQPLLRLSSTWQSIQELKVSFERLADVINTPLESNSADQSKIPLPPIEGEVTFESVTFSFQAGTPAVLKEIDLTVPAGTFLGIVGQSGSGKSTLMKLLPRLYAPDRGRVLVDGYDIDKVELYSLRRQVGIVPQDPLLFSGTVAENIALTQPEADSDEIVRVARLACAHEFIMELPAGYSTIVGERGASLSGGQRQRIAIARTLLSNPKLLVMDEATSALDYDTERRVCDNLVESLKDCTVFFITHRLSTIRRAHTIVMMHQGAIVETGTHDELMAMRGRYFALYRQQEAS